MNLRSISVIAIAATLGGVMLQSCKKKVEVAEQPPVTEADTRSAAVKELNAEVRSVNATYPRKINDTITLVKETFDGKNMVYNYTVDEDVLTAAGSDFDTFVLDPRNKEALRAANISMIGADKLSEYQAMSVTVVADYQSTKSDAKLSLVIYDPHIPQQH